MRLEELRGLRNRVRCTWLRHESLRIVTDINRATVMANPDGYRRRIEAIPRGVPGRVEWLVGPVVMLLSPGSVHLTGQVICVDGGISTGDTFVMDKKQ